MFYKLLITCVYHSNRGFGSKETLYFILSVVLTSCIHMFCKFPLKCKYYMNELFELVILIQMTIQMLEFKSHINCVRKIWIGKCENSSDLLDCHDILFNKRIHYKDQNVIYNNAVFVHGTNAQQPHVYFWMKLFTQLTQTGFSDATNHNYSWLTPSWKYVCSIGCQLCLFNH